MSQIGRKPISIPEGVSVTNDLNNISIKGKLGLLEYQFNSDITIDISDSLINVSRKSDEKEYRQLHGLTRAIAVDHGLDGVRCNAVAPGWIKTKLNEDFINSIDNSKNFKINLNKIHPIGRTGEPSEVANLICWLSSDEASFVTGQVWTIDGGRMTKLSLPAS